MSNQTKRNYTQEFKQEAVKLVTEQGYKVSEAARNLGLSRSMLGRWRREFDAEKAGERLGGGEREELKRLRSEVKRLRMEREILKKAAAFFAKESS
jgi:transposase